MTMCLILSDNLLVCQVKKKKFFDNHNLDEIVPWVGEGLDMEQEFDSIDQDKDGKIFFKDFIDWAFNKNIQKEWAKLEAQNNIENGENED